MALHAGVLLWIPLGGHTLETDSQPRVMPKVVLSGQPLEHLLYSASVAGLIRQDSTIGSVVQTAGNVAGSEIQVGASASWIDSGLGLSVGPELIFSTLLSAHQSLNRYLTGLEILAGAHYRPVSELQVSLGIGLGILRAPGTPDVRALARIAYTPRYTESASADRDLDGITDAADLCADLAAGPIPDPNRVGCPRPDSDGDGFFDDADACPQEAVGLTADPNRPGCPMPPASPARPTAPSDKIDSDNDGVLDPQDVCLNEPMGALADPNRLGCPAPDTDHDGVPDAIDVCPNTPASALADAHRLGCPEVLKVKLEGQHFVTEPIQFANGKDVILRESFPVLQALIDILRTHPGIMRMVVQGHTDNHGNAKKNLDLSARRAKAVVTFMRRAGIAADRLESQGFGDTKPIATNNTTLGRTLNRRVEFTILR